MVKLRVPAVLILFTMNNVNLVKPLVQESLSKFLGSFAGVKQYSFFKPQIAIYLDTVNEEV